MMQLFLGLAAGLVVGLVMEWMIDWSSFSVRGRSRDTGPQIAPRRDKAGDPSATDHADADRRPSELGGE